MLPCARSWSERLALEIATLAGVGRLPKAPGTWGTLATVPLCGWVQQGGLWLHGAVLLGVLLLGTWATAVACRLYDRKDPPQVVVDEAAGLLLTMLMAPTGWPWLLAGFTLFRLFDIWKPWPVCWLDRQLGSPWGVMADDLAAAVYAGLSIMLLAGIIVP
ncbi:MAG: phosphatidylglycerophosphatase A [Magnetococcales bacterium]|nr:phosphatidylglycerophosphatase A [Magnetococcales bacterium]